MKVRVTHHGMCPHEAETWNLAFSAALSHAEVTITPMSRQATIRALMQSGAKGIWHQGTHFVGKVIA